MKVKISSGIGVALVVIATASPGAEATMITPHVVTPQMVQSEVVTHPASAASPPPAPRSAPTPEPVGSSYAPAPTPSPAPAGASGNWGETRSPTPRRLGETGPDPDPTPISTWYLPDPSDPACSLSCLKAWAAASEGQYDRDVSSDIDRLEASWGAMIEMQARVAETFDPSQEGPEEYFIRREAESDHLFELLSGVSEPGLGLETSPEVEQQLVAEFQAGLEEEGFLVATNRVGETLHADAMTDAGGTPGPPTASLDDFAELRPGTVRRRPRGLGRGRGPGQDPARGRRAQRQLTRVATGRA